MNKMDKKKVIMEDIFIEELKSLLAGKTIDFYSDENIEIKITGKNFKGIPLFKRFIQELEMTDKRLELRDNVLERYDNGEYWLLDILENPDYDNEN